MSRPTPTPAKPASTKSFLVTGGLFVFALLSAAAGEYGLGGICLIAGVVAGGLVDRAKPFTPAPGGYSPGISQAAGVGAGAGSSSSDFMADSSSTDVGAMSGMMDIDNSIDLQHDYIYHDELCSQWHSTSFDDDNRIGGIND